MLYPIYSMHEDEGEPGDWGIMGRDERGEPQEAIATGLTENDAADLLFHLNAAALILARNKADGAATDDSEPGAPGNPRSTYDD